MCGTWETTSGLLAGFLGTAVSSAVLSVPAAIYGVAGLATDVYDTVTTLPGGPDISDVIARDQALHPRRVNPDRRVPPRPPAAAPPTHAQVMAAEQQRTRLAATQGDAMAYDPRDQVPRASAPEPTFVSVGDVDPVAARNRAAEIHLD